MTYIGDFCKVFYIGDMANLTLKQVIEAAPGAAPVDDPTLLSTPWVIRYLSRLNYKPVFALQSTEHRRRTAWKGQHLVVMAHANGRAFAFLNSHNKNMRARIGYGYWNGSEVLIGPVVALQRWRSFQKQFEGLAQWGSKIAALAGHLDVRVSVTGAEWLAHLIALSAYPVGHRLPNGADLIEHKAQPLGVLLFGAMARMRRGGLSAEDGGRAIKAFSSPTTVFNAARETLRTAVDFRVKRREMPSGFRGMFVDPDDR